MRLKGKKVLVYGLGTSGQEVCKLLHSEGACVSIYDDDKRFSGLFCYEKKPEEKNFDFVVVYFDGMYYSLIDSFVVVVTLVFFLVVVVFDLMTLID